jgi:hypothetical protein
MNNPIDRRTVLLGVGALAVAGPCLAAQRVGAVMSVAGSAFLERSASRLAAAGGAEVMLDDLALTGDDSRLDLRIGRATRIKLGARSQLKIDRFTAGVSADVELLDGPAFIEHRSGAEPGFYLDLPLRVDRGTRHGFLRRAKRGRVRRLRSQRPRRCAHALGQRAPSRRRGYRHRRAGRRADAA